MGDEVYLVFKSISDEEWTQFGDRLTKGYEKKKLLGRGGFAMVNFIFIKHQVWLGENKKTKDSLESNEIE